MSMKPHSFMPQGNLSQINLNQLKVFEAVYRLKSMTKAALELNLTQSGISQHVLKLESELKIKLFVRNYKEIFTTPEADEIYKTTLKSFEEISNVINSFQMTKTKEISGVIKVGLPTEIGNNVIIPNISQWSLTKQKVYFDIIYGYGTKLLENLEKQEIDLALVDSFKKGNRFSSEVIFKEKLNLVVSKQYLANQKIDFANSRTKINSLEKIDYIEYEPKESILRLWFEYHYSRKNPPLNIRAWAMNVQGVSAFVKASMGAAILPNHVISRLIEEGSQLYVIRGTKEDLTNEISLVSLKNRPLSKAAEDLRFYLIQLMK